jgi:hypothetical protein
MMSAMSYPADVLLLLSSINCHQPCMPRSLHVTSKPCCDLCFDALRRIGALLGHIAPTHEPHTSINDPMQCHNCALPSAQLQRP